MNNKSLEDRYQEIFCTALTPIAERLQNFLVKMLDDLERIDRISARAKDPDRFIAKAYKVDDFGKNKYDQPLYEIQDQIGARIIVFYKNDVDIVKECVLKYFSAIEIQSKEPERASEFGYFGEHFILRLPDDVIPDGLEDMSPDFFELQVKTLFQHAWSEAHHDLGYKSSRDLTAYEQRQIALSAAQAWGADEIFAELAAKLVYPQ